MLRQPRRPRVGQRARRRDRRAVSRPTADPRAHLRPPAVGSSNPRRVRGAMDTRKSTDTAATVIIGQKVRPGCERDFETWQLNVNSRAAVYPGFLGAEVN